MLLCGTQDLRTAFLYVIRGLLVRLLCFGLGVNVRREALDGLAEADGASAGYFGLERVEAARDVQVLCHVRRCNALAEVLEAAARGLRVLARKRLDLVRDGGVVAQDVIRQSVRHVGMPCGASLMGPARIGAVSSWVSRRRSTGAWMRALSESWSAESECHCCEHNQSRTFHFVPPFVWAGGDKTGLAAALAEGSYLVFRMRQTLMGMQGPCAPFFYFLLSCVQAARSRTYTFISN